MFRSTVATTYALIHKTETPFKLTQLTSIREVDNILSNSTLPECVHSHLRYGVVEEMISRCKLVGYNGPCYLSTEAFSLVETVYSSFFRHVIFFPPLEFALLNIIYIDAS